MGEVGVLAGVAKHVSVVVGPEIARRVLKGGDALCVEIRTTACRSALNRRHKGNSGHPIRQSRRRTGRAHGTDRTGATGQSQMSSLTDIRQKHKIIKTETKTETDN